MTPNHHLSTSSPLPRRHFLKTAAALSALAAGLPLALGAGRVTRPVSQAAPSKAAKPLRILILGGTGFLGPAVVDAAKARGHTVTLFNRGKTEKRKGITVDAEEKLVGDRDPDKYAGTKFVDGKDVEDTTTPKGLSQLEGKTWDAVVDNSGYFPRMVKASAELLAKSVKQYVFISTISVYESNDKPGGADETAPVGKLEDTTTESMGTQSERYGPLKALCEQATEAALPGRVTNIRPGFIVGPNDPTDRFTYWPVRIDKGGDVLIPGAPTDPVQVIDVRDLAAWIILCIEKNIVGVFNACGPAKELPWGDVVTACKDLSPGARAAKTTYVPATFLNENGLPTGSLPIWLPPTGETAGFHRWSNKKAVAAGLTFRPVAQTCKDLLEWWPKEVERRRTAGERIVADAKAEGRPVPKIPPHDVLRTAIPGDAEATILAAFRKATPESSPKPEQTPPGK